MKDLEKKIFEYLSKNLSPKRFEHSYNVSKFACELAGIYGTDILKTQTAALVHDCAKGMNDSMLINILKKSGTRIKYFDEISHHAPGLLHSFAGALIAEKEFKIKDNEILNAVRYHTLGRPGMDMLEKILFVSDAVSYDRKYKGIAKIRKLAKTDIEEAFLSVLSNKIIYIIKEGMWLCLQTIDTWNYYAQKN